MKIVNKIIFLIIMSAIMSTKTVNSNISNYSSKKLDINSPSFLNDEFMPVKYGCSGENVSPELSWMGAPDGTKSFALLVEDPDAPKEIWVHWLLFNIDNDIFKLEEDFNIEDYKDKSKDIKQGKNSFGHNNYGGPCPPTGQTHRYIFRIYALDTMLNLNEGSTKEEFLDAIKNHILDQAELVGLYKKNV